jgi:hypothetical protein
MEAGTGARTRLSSCRAARYGATARPLPVRSHHPVTGSPEPRPSPESITETIINAYQVAP